MKRRSFLAALFAAPAAAAVVPVKPSIPPGLLPKNPTRPTPRAADLTVANIGQVHAGVIRSADGGMVIDVAAGHIFLRA